MTSLASLEIPDWVPTEVAGVARMMTTLALPPVEVVQVTRRLLRDERMQKVWTELGRCRREEYRPTNKKFHETNLPPEIESWGAMSQTWKSRAAENQAIGDQPFAAFFSTLARAAEVAANDSPSVPIPDHLRHGIALALYFAIAAALFVSGEKSVSRKDVESWEMGLRLRGFAERANAIHDIVAKPQVSRLIVDRQRQDPRLKAFVVNLAYWCESMFGDPMARTIATTANVVFEKTGPDELTRNTVRAFLKHLK